MLGVTVDELRIFEEKAMAVIDRVPESNDEEAWAILEGDLYELFTRIRELKERCGGEVEHWLSRASRFVLEAMRACEQAPLVVKHAVGEAAECLNQARQAFQSPAEEP